MWDAMRSAEIGWPQRGDDKNVNELEGRAAELAGKEAGLFLFTASLGNLLAIMGATSRGDQIVLEADAHQVWIEGWNLAYVCGVYPRLVSSSDGAMPLPEIETILNEWRPHGPPHTPLHPARSPA